MHTSIKILITAVSITVASVITAQAKNNNVQYKGVMKNIPFTTISFAQDSYTLSDSDRTSLRQLSIDAHKKGLIESTAVAAWSDKPFPKNGKSLPRADIDLASRRADAIKDFLKQELYFSSIDIYNMAETSNWLARTFNTSDAKMKNVFSKKGALPPVAHAEFNVIRNEGGPSRVVVVIENQPNP